MATLSLVGCGEAVNVDRAQVAALGTFERMWEAPTMRLAEGVSLTFRDSSDPAQERTYQMHAALLVTPPGAFDAPRAGQDSGSESSGPIGGNARDGEQARPVVSPQSEAVSSVLLMWLDDEVRAGRVSRSAAAWLGDAVIERTRLGVERYGSPLMSHNGRDALRDLAEEVVDGVQYATQALMETDDVDETAWLWAARAKLLGAAADLERVRGGR
jgi:hypothetical protein